MLPNPNLRWGRGEGSTQHCACSSFSGTKVLGEVAASASEWDSQSPLAGARCDDVDWWLRFLSVAALWRPLLRTRLHRLDLRAQPQHREPIRAQAFDLGGRGLQGL